MLLAAEKSRREHYKKMNGSVQPLLLLLCITLNYCIH